MTDKEAMKLALEALKFALHVGFDESSESQIKKGDKAVQQHQNAITALQEALAEQPAQQEPVAWMHKETGLLRQANKAKGGDFEPNHWTPLYTSPPARKPWVGLTNEEKQEWIDAMPYNLEPRHCMILVNVIEAKLKEKNCG